MSAYIPSSTQDNTEVVVSPKTYTTKIDQATTDVMYIGKAVPGTLGSAASWQIQRLTSVGDDLDVEFAAAGEFSQIWNNRASLSYS